MKSLNLPAAIAAEIARAVTIEMQVQISGSARADFLAGQMARVTGKLRQGTEYGAAKGGLIRRADDEALCFGGVDRGGFCAG